MAYYQGDYYRGDPGFFGDIGRFLGGAAKAAVGVGAAVLPGPAGMALRFVKQKISRPTTRQVTPPPPISIQPPQMMPFVQPPSTIQPGVGVGPGVMMPTRKRRRMNVANPKALRRAIRREQGFVKLARKALKGTGYRVTSAAAARRPTRISERGPGSVVVH